MEKMETLRKQFELERHYHFELMNEANAKNRLEIYEEAYNAFYSFVKENNPAKIHFGSCDINFYRVFFKDKVAVEYGCGYGVIACEIAKFVIKIYGIDIASNLIVQAKSMAENENLDAEFLLPSEIDKKIPDNSIDIFFCSNVFEHLHPDDLYEHLKLSHKKLREGGEYLVITPHAFSGPHDISSKFLPKGAPSEGLHLKEYSYSELTNVFKKCNFKYVKGPLTLMGIKRLRLEHQLKNFFVTTKWHAFLEKIIPHSCFSNKILSKPLGLSSVCILAIK
jgi:SAM-dependent methyltransferase